MNGAQYRTTAGGGFGLTGPVPRDIIALLVVLLTTFSLGEFAATQGLHALLMLTSNVWRHGFVWQPVTYLFNGVGEPGIWFLLELLILFLFGRTVYFQLGRKGFWRFLVTIGVAVSLLAVLVDLVVSNLATPSPFAFALMQGQHMILTLLIAAFATMNRDATILLMFVLPVQAKWFLPLTVLFAFMGFLRTSDLPGFVGLVAAVGFTYLYLSTAASRPSARRGWLRLQEWWIRQRLKTMRRQRKMRLVEDEEPGNDDDWVH